MAAATDADVEEEIWTYIKMCEQRGDVPTRDGAIRHVTGELTTMPSDVAKILKGLFASGALIHGPSDRLVVKKRPA